MRDESVLGQCQRSAQRNWHESESIFDMDQNRGSFCLYTVKMPFRVQPIPGSRPGTPPQSGGDKPQPTPTPPTPGWGFNLRYAKFAT